MADAMPRSPVQLKSWHYIFLLACIFTIKDLFLNQIQSTPSSKSTQRVSEGYRMSDSEEKSGFPGSQYDDKLPIAGSKLSSAKFGGPAIKFLFCQAFQQFSSMIQQRHPEVIVEGANFPPPFINTVIARVVSVVKFLLLGCIFMGINPMEYIGVGHIGYSSWTWVSQNKIYASLMIFFLLNFVETTLLSTGAFEIYFNDVPVWSKIQTGRVPSPPELLQIVDNNLKLMKNADDFDLML